MGFSEEIRLAGEEGMARFARQRSKGRANKGRTADGQLVSTCRGHTHSLVARGIATMHASSQARRHTCTAVAAQPECPDEAA